MKLIRNCPRLSSRRCSRQHRTCQLCACTISITGTDHGSPPQVFRFTSRSLAVTRSPLDGRRRLFLLRWQAERCTNCPNGKERLRTIGGTSSRGECCTRHIAAHSRCLITIRGLVTTEPPRHLLFTRLCFLSSGTGRGI